MFVFLFEFSVQTFEPLMVIYSRGNLCIIIGDVNQFVGHCLIPLDPWEKLMLSRYGFIHDERQDHVKKRSDQEHKNIEKEMNR